MTIQLPFQLDNLDPSWQPYIIEGLQKIDPAYLYQLNNTTWLPGPEKIFNAFTLPVNQIHYVLLGESPYPRKESANGYAFWDAAVNQLWSSTGLSKQVNRATSLRNILKMLLVAEGVLSPEDTSQPAIAKLKKHHFISTNQELFTHLLQHGFLLLNATLILRENEVKKDARSWQPFLEYIFQYLASERPEIQFLLFGNIANQIEPLISHLPIKKLYAEHPYNLSFIQNKTILDFFQPLHLLKRE